MRFVILHYHIFKNAGTTIEEILIKSFPARFAKLDTEDHDALLSNSVLLDRLNSNSDLQAISSHQLRYPVPQVKGFLFFDVCFLRDPLDRIRSMYDYFREKHFPGVTLSDLAQSMGFGGFAATLVDHHPHYVNDAQVNFLAGRSVDAPPAEEPDLELATRRLLNMSFPGVVDCFDESLTAGQHLLSPAFPTLNCAQPPVNTSKRLGSTFDMCESRVYAELVRLNALDTELVRRAREEVHRRFKLVRGFDRSLCFEKTDAAAAER